METNMLELSDEIILKLSEAKETTKKLIDARIKRGLSTTRCANIVKEIENLARVVEDHRKNNHGYYPTN